MTYLTTAQAAIELRVGRSRVLALIRADRLKASKIGRDWIIEPSALDAVRVRIPGWKKGRLRGKRPPRPPKPSLPPSTIEPPSAKVPF
jgi:excisionase family DNA binding protein